MTTTSTNTTTTNVFPIPKIVQDIFSRFPLYTYPAILPPKSTSSAAAATRPTLWIHPPIPDIILPSTNLLSADVSCLKWQAFIALCANNITADGAHPEPVMAVRWDVDPEGGVDGVLPSLQLPPSSDGDEKASLLAAKDIPSWVRQARHRADPAAAAGNDDLEGYNDPDARDESRAWVSLLEGPVHAALVGLIHSFTVY